MKRQGRGIMTAGATALRRRAGIHLLEIKDVDIRVLTLEQARAAVDRGIHSGGAFSAVIPLVTLYYSGFMRVDIENPSSKNQDYFILSKGHGVASMASIYADLGYFDRAVLSGSRGYRSILNGHPGPLLPGVHTATGPMGQGICLAGGLALAGQLDERFDVFAVTGDGELQEGTSWEAVMLAGSRGSENLCVIVDNNHGQLDNPRALHLRMEGIADQFRAFGWLVLEVDGTRYGPMYDAISAFKCGPRNGQPLAIISRTTKGWGGFADELVRHKTTLPDSIIDPEIEQQLQLRRHRVAEFFSLYDAIDDVDLKDEIESLAKAMNLRIGQSSVDAVVADVRTRQAPPRDKRIPVDGLPELDPEKEYASDEVISMAMSILAKDPRVVSVDSDLSSTSGLQPGISRVDSRRGINVGIAEANMMAIGEAFALLGYNAWVSTFCPFFNWNFLRRIAVSAQERQEVMATPDGWLSEGHGLDLTFLATASNFETRTNGATHMGNDDAMTLRGVAGLKIIDISCPNLLLSAIHWIMGGNRGLVYVRVMRSGSRALYSKRPEFDFGRSFTLKGDGRSALTIVSSGRGVHEALAAAELLAKNGIDARVVDMPSVDEQTMLELHDGGSPVLFAEQNNGYLFSEFERVCCENRKSVRLDHVRATNALGADRRPRFIHSGTYEELTEAHGLAPEQIAQTAAEMLG